MYVEKLPPHSVEAEEAVVGSLLIDGETFLRVQPLLKPGDFYREKNRWCYEACQNLYERDEAINELTVAHEINRLGRLDGIGGPSYLSYLVSIVPTSVHAEHYARIVSRSSTLRRLINAAGEIADIGYEGPADVEDALTQAEGVLFRIRSGRERRDFVSLRDVLDTYLEQTTTAALAPLGQHEGPVPTGFRDLDRLLGGLQRSDMVVLAARPSLGKSALALNIGRYAAGQGSRVAVFSLEMGREQLAMRLLASEAGVDSHRLRLHLYNEMEEHRIHESVGALSDLPVWIDDTPLVTIVEIRSKVRRLHAEVGGLDLVLVDYMQLAAGGSGRPENRVAEMGEISRSLKGVARDLKVPLIAVSQLSRDIERRERDGRRPRLSDLRESGSIEQDADVVAFIYREDKAYSEEEWARRFPERPYPHNVAEIIVEKHRHGPVGRVELYFNERLARFENLARLEPYE